MVRFKASARASGGLGNYVNTLMTANQSYTRTVGIWEISTKIIQIESKDRQVARERVNQVGCQLFVYVLHWVKSSDGNDLSLDLI